MKIRANKIGSITRRLDLTNLLTLEEAIDSVEGAVIAARVLSEKQTYNYLEDVHGRMTSLKPGDVIVGALGRRHALHGYAGEVPAQLDPGDHIQLLNLGGVMGLCTSQNPDLGPPFELEALGQVLDFPGFQSRRGVPANIAQYAAAAPHVLPDCPVIAVCGACMNSGKTIAASTIVSTLADAGLTVAAAKLTGVSLLRDILSLRDYGASVIYDFTDAGLPSTSAANAVFAARKILGLLASAKCDVIVLEMGDGIFGQYGVQQILAEPDLRSIISVLIYCAGDPAGAYGGILTLRESYGLAVDIVSGPVTDNLVGKQFIEDNLAAVALNARLEPAALGAKIRQLLETHKRSKAVPHAG